MKGHCTSGRNKSPCKRKSPQLSSSERLFELFLRLMRGFDAEDVEVIRKAVESNGVDSKACAPGPPMDERNDDDQPEEDSGLIPQIDRPMSMPYLCCKLWRWKDLQAIVTGVKAFAACHHPLICQLRRRCIPLSRCVLADNSSSSQSWHV
ncbi:hypothetical protein KIN20_029633 [Parelaphostrongylus tenuis]|uniref:MH1 domain-containing protein n=1 Tax=Parelaphostrongylus tenuis TaxID=148309 RepID=A0AAD5WFU3_PARTN|nr:hypothetical protein KIN20_029633 [Parelaphostrongylus tenuis]